MKELEQKPENKIEFVKQAEIEKKQVLIGKMKPQKGHIVWEFNKKTLEIVPAQFQKLPASYQAKAVLKTNNLHYFQKHTTFSGSKIIIKQDCLYIPALNKKNVIKILERDFGINYSNLPI